MRLASWLTVMLVSACGEPRPRPIDYGTIECVHCHMTVADPRFSAELVTRRHKVFVFDDPGCLAAFVATGTVQAEEIHSLWVSDFLRPDSLLDARHAVFIASDEIRTPMNSGVLAVHPGAAVDSLRAELSGTVKTWDEVVAAASEHQHTEP